MASYTDKAPTFNPYVAHQPVDAMLKVGMEKQRLYQQGYEKIQNSIDKVAGLELYRDVDKSYMQSKLNELGTKLKGVAAGDFSNFQLTNSVAGMAGQLANDVNIQNAVASTAWLKKQQNEMQVAKKAGKSSASNEWDFSQKANAYLNSTTIGEKFNETYTPFTDYKKNALEVIKSLAKNETTRDVAIETDEKGNMVVLDAMTRTKIAGITPERIQSALMVGLNPNDFKQLQLDGRYNYSNVSPEKFMSDVDNSYKRDFNALKAQRDILANSLDSTNSVSAKRKIQEQVASLDKSLEGIATEYENINNSFKSGDVESAKANLHTAKWINNFSQTFSSQEISQTYEASHHQQVKQFKETKAQDWNKFIYKFEQDERFNQQDEHWKAEAHKLALEKNEREKKTAAFTEGYSSVPFSVDQSTLPEVTLDKLIVDVEADKININKSDSAIMKQFGKEGNTQWLQQQLMLWQNSSGSVDPLLASHFNRTENTRRDIAATTSMITEISKEADKQYGTVYNKIPADSRAMTVQFPSGSYTYTPKELVDFNEKSKRYRSISGPGEAPVSGPGVLYNDAKAKQELSPKEYFLYKAQQEQGTPTQKILAENLRKYNTSVNIPYQKTIQEKNSFVAKEVKSRVMAMQGVEYGIPLGTEEQKTTFGNTLVSIANLADSQAGGLANSPELSTKDLRKIAGGLQNATIRIVEGTRYAPAMYEVTASDKDGNTQSFRVPPEAYRTIFKDRYEATPSVQGARPIINQIIRTGAGTTALDGGITTPANSYLGNLEFKNVKYYGASGNVVQDAQTGLYSIRLNLIDPLTKQTVVQNLAYPSNGLIEENKILPAFEQLTDSKVFQMIYNRIPTEKELDLIKKASQNPQ